MACAHSARSGCQAWQCRPGACFRLTPLNALSSHAPPIVKTTKTCVSLGTQIALKGGSVSSRRCPTQSQLNRISVIRTLLCLGSFYLNPSFAYGLLLCVCVCMCMCASAPVCICVSCAFFFFSTLVCLFPCLFSKERGKGLVLDGWGSRGELGDKGEETMMGIYYLQMISI